MGKATKRERQKLNKALREEEQARKESRKKTFRTIKTLVLILIVPVVILVATAINNLTDPDVYTAKITVSIEGEKDLLNDGVIEIELDYAYSQDSVNHFIGFASNGLYNELDWHHVTRNFAIRSGAGEGGSGHIGSSITAEVPRNGYKAGDVIWAIDENQPAGTAGSQFLLLTGKENSRQIRELNKKTEQFDGSTSYQNGFIGRITSGLNLARMIEDLAPSQDGNNAAKDDGPPTKKATIVSVEVFKNGNKVQPGDRLPATTAATTSSTVPLTQPVGGVPESTQSNP